jgi:integral membrane protein (TIGR01906 family)
MKIGMVVARWVFVLCLPVMLFTATVGVAFNCIWLYKYDFNKYDISAVTGLPSSELDRAAGGLISYWNSGEEYIDITVTREGQAFTLFNEREVIHLKDVKALVRLDYLALAVTGAYCLIFAAVALWWRKAENRRQLALAGMGGSMLSGAMLLTLGIMAVSNFDGFWRQFHVLSFANDFWLLDPSRDYLIMMFPEGFWYDSVLIIAGTMALLALIIGVLSWVYLRKGRERLLLYG